MSTRGCSGRGGPRLRWVLLGVLAGAACSSGSQPQDDARLDGSAAEASPDNGLPQIDPPPVADPFAVWVPPGGRNAFTTSEEELAFEGVAVGAVEQLAVEVVRPDGTSESLGVSPAARFATPPILLAEGEHRLVLRARFASGTTSEDVLLVTHTPELELGPLTFEKPEVFAGETPTQRVSIAIDGARASEVGTVELVAGDSAAPDTAPALLALNDAGQDGDAQAGDRVYSGTLGVAAQGVGKYPLRARIVSDWDDWRVLSETATLEVFSPLTADEVDSWEASLALARQKIEELSASLPAAEARAALVQALLAAPHVKEAGTVEGTDSVWWIMDSGLGAGLSDAPAGTRGGGDLVAKLDVLLFNPWDESFGSSSNCRKADELLPRSKCPDLGPTDQRIGDQATVEAFKRIHDYGVVIVDAHGGVHKNGEAAIILAEQVPPGGSKDPTNPHRMDLRTGRLQGWTVRSGPPGWLYAITGKFIAHYNAPFPRNSLLYVGSCYSTANQSLSRPFLRNGGGVLAGYTHSVWNAYTAGIFDPFFNSLLEGKNAFKAWTAAVLRSGPCDPQAPLACFTLQPPAATAQLAVPCQGYTQVVDTADYAGDSSGYGRVTGSTELRTLDQITVSPFDRTGNTYIMKHMFKECSYHYKFGDPQDPGEVRAGHGMTTQEYADIPANPLEEGVNPNARYGVVKLVVDRDAGTVKIYPIVDNALFDQDDVGWVDQLVDRGSGNISRMEGGCEFHGASEDMPPDQYLWDAITTRNVVFGASEVSGNFQTSNERGTLTVEFSYRLP